MHQITCPHCGTAFQVNETEYSQLLAQVRGADFDKEIHDRLERERELLSQKAENDLQARLSDKDKEILELTAKLDKFASQTELEISSAISKKDQEIQELKAQLGQIGLAKDLELQQAVAQVEKERDAAQNALVLQEQKQELALGPLVRSTKYGSRRRMSRWNFTKISRPSSLLRQLERAWSNLLRRSLTRFVPMLFHVPNLRRTTKYQRPVQKEISSSVILTSRAWNLFPSCSK